MRLKQPHAFPTVLEQSVQGHGIDLVNEIVTVSWKTCRKGGKLISGIIKAQRHEMWSDNVIVMFQEVPNWAAADETELAGRRFKMFASKDSSCALVLPSYPATVAVDAGTGRDWAGCSTENVVALSMHLFP